MRRARNNPILVFQTIITILHNIYRVIIDLNRCFQLFSEKFVENIVIALDSKTSILDSNIVGYGVACKANHLKNSKLIYTISKEYNFKIP